MIGELKGTIVPFKDTSCNSRVMGGGMEADFRALFIRTNPSEPPMYILPSLATNAGLAKKVVR